MHFATQRMLFVYASLSSHFVFVVPLMLCCPLSTENVFALDVVAVAVVQFIQKHAMNS